MSSLEELVSKVQAAVKKAKEAAASQPYTGAPQASKSGAGAGEAPMDVDEDEEEPEDFFGKLFEKEQETAKAEQRETMPARQVIKRYLDTNYAGRKVRVCSKKPKV